MQRYSSSKSRDKRSSIQKFKDNFVQQKDKSTLYPNGRQEEIENGSNHPQITFLAIVFRVSDNRRRDIDGMVSTVLDALVASGRIADDDLGTIPSIFTTWLPCEKGDEGFDVVIGEL
jgi:Holliday junction resolvase RusA-like endonuclease